MTGQRIFIWTGGQPGRDAAECGRWGDALPAFPAPAPLRRAALIEYQWGSTKFEIAVTACSVRTTPWGGEQVSWLHCKAKQTATIKEDEPVELMTILIPARYVTRIEAGPTFRLTRSRLAKDLGVFPPNQPAPVNALPLAEIERIITALLVPERN